MAAINETRGHILVFPFPAQGHMLPLLDLTHQLSLKNLKITVLITPKNLPILNPLLSTNPSIQTLILPFPSHPLIPNGVENVKDLGNSGNIPIITALSQLGEDIVHWFDSLSDPPVAILSDFFLGWTHYLAERIGIPRIVFYSSGSFSTAVMNILWENPDAVKIGDTVNFQDLPGKPSFEWEHNPSVFRRYRESEPRDEMVRKWMMGNGLSWASVFNTFDGLESKFLGFWKEKMGHQRIYAVGPLNLVGGPNEVRVNDEKKVESDEVLSWLDQFEDDGSVLYVCFGSQKLLKKAQFEALANGLETSGVRFVWVVKPLTDQQVANGYGVVPEGFEERVAGRGFVINGWAPQVPILSHRAVGGFLSHCGWNSVLEAITTGVMILGWPMEADQFINARLLVDYKRAAFLVCQGNDTVPNPIELARVIAKSMCPDAVERIRAKELRDKAFDAVKNGGSSSKDLDTLVEEIKLLQV